MVQAKALTLILEGPFKIRTHLLRMEEGAGDVVGVTPEGVHLPSLALWTWGEEIIINSSSNETPRLSFREVAIYRQGLIHGLTVVTPKLDLTVVSSRNDKR
jgi:hypothetical protein